MARSHSQPRAPEALRNGASFILGTSFLMLAATESALGDPALATAAENTASSTGLEEIIVTARRREESLQKVPVAITVLNPDALREQNIRKADDLQVAVPSLDLQPGLEGNVSERFFIRGQGVGTGGVLPSVVAYFAEVPLDANGGGAFAMADLDSVQVLRGPQGTLFGRNSNGGAVVLSPKAPGDSFDAAVDASYGNYHYGDIKGGVTLPLAATLSVRISGEYLNHDAFVTNLSGPDLDNLRSESARVFFRWTPSGSFGDDLIYQYQHTTSNGIAGIIDAVRPNSAGALFYPLPGLPLERGTGLANDLIQQNAYGPFTVNDPATYFGEESKIGLLANTARFEFDNITLKNITGVERVNVCPSVPVASTYTNFYISTCIPNIYNQSANVPIYPTYDLTQITNETNASGKVLNDRLDWIAGIFVLWENPTGGLGNFRLNQMSKALFVANFATTVEQDRSQAIYSQGTYAITDNVKFTGGLRYTWDQRSLQFGEASSDVNGLAGTYACASPGLAPTTPLAQCLNIYHADFGALGYTFDLDWQVAPNLLLYVTTRKGYKAGGFNNTATQKNPEYSPEDLKDVEIGEKFQWGSSDFRGVVNADVFHSWYDSIQQQLTTYVNGNTAVVVTNAGNAQFNGAEVEASMTMFDRLTVSAFDSYIDAHYDACPSNPGPGSCFLDNRVNVTTSQMLGLAKRTLSATVKYRQPLANDSNLSGSVTYYTKSDVAYAADNVLNYEGIAPAYHLINSRLDWAYNKDLTIGVYGNNLANKAYVISGFGLGSLIGTDSRFYGDPRTYGVEVYYHFSR